MQNNIAFASGGLKERAQPKKLEKQRKSTYIAAHKQGTRCQMMHAFKMKEQRARIRKERPGIGMKGGSSHLGMPTRQRAKMHVNVSTRTSTQ